MLYTDGVTEARGAAASCSARTACTRRCDARRGSANGLTYGLLDDVLAFQSGATADDIVIVTVHVPT